MGHIVSNHERFQVQAFAFVLTLLIEQLDSLTILLLCYFYTIEQWHPFAGY